MVFLLPDTNFDVIALDFLALLLLTIICIPIVLFPYKVCKL